jgi:hypothetical protein
MNEWFRHARKFIENVLARDTNLWCSPERDLPVASMFVNRMAWKMSGDGMVYRVYFGQKGRTLVVLLCGGDQRTEDRDIRLAKQFWHEFKQSDL